MFFFKNHFCGVNMNKTLYYYILILSNLFTNKVLHNTQKEREKDNNRIMVFIVKKQLTLKEILFFLIQIEII